MRLTNLLPCLFLFLTSCAGSSDPLLTYQKLDTLPPTSTSIPHCKGYGCRIITQQTLSAQETGKIERLFQNNHTAERERNNIKKAIALLETIIGIKTNTSTDVGGTYVQLGNDQLDCIDESTNTTSYMLLLQNMNLLKFHIPNALTSRPPIFSGRLGPHRTAVIKEIETGQKYAVDSWRFDNGEQPEIMPLEEWK